MKRLLVAVAVLGALILYVLATQDLLVESFEGTGYENPDWTETVGTNDVVDENYTGVELPPDGGSQCLRLVAASPDFDDITRKYLASQQPVTYTEFKFRLKSHALVDLNTEIVLAQAHDTSWRTAWQLVLRKLLNGDVLLRVYLSSGGTSVNHSADSVVMLDHWYTVRLKHDAVNHQVEWWLDGVLEYSATFTDDHAAGFNRLQLGQTVTPAYAHEAFFDALKISSTGWAAPEMDITGVADGGTYDFGSKTVGEDTDYTFTISNGGEDTLNLSGSPIVAITGAHADQFSVQTQPDATVATDGSTTFHARFSPTSAGAKTATIAIANDDADENPYDITLTGTGVAAATRKPIVILLMNGHR